MSFLNNSNSESDKNENDKTSDFSVGDIFYNKIDNKYHLYKLLAIDKDFDCYHVLSYSELDSLPTINDIDNLPIFIFHSPFDKKAFSDAILLANTNLTAHDLIGYHAYLRETQDPEINISMAIEYFNAGLSLTDQNMHYEAIDSYSKAIDIFPPLFEAIDNRAFCKMDLGMWGEAIADFKISLEKNPNSLLAEFSIGECYFNMGDYKNAKRQFQIAHAIDPNHETTNLFLKKVNDILV